MPKCYHADLLRQIARVLGIPESGEGSSWHDMPERVQRLQGNIRVLNDQIMRLAGSIDRANMRIAELESRPTLDQARNAAIEAETAQPEPDRAERALPFLLPRDWFAAVALMGLSRMDTTDAQVLAVSAYDLADAMLIERATEREDIPHA